MYVFSFSYYIPRVIGFIIIYYYNFTYVKSTALFETGRGGREENRTGSNGERYKIFRAGARAPVPPAPDFLFPV